MGCGLRMAWSACERNTYLQVDPFLSVASGYPWEGQSLLRSARPRDVKAPENIENKKA